MRKLLWLLLIGSAFGQTAVVSGTIHDPSGANATASLVFSLRGCNGNQPIYSGSSIITGEQDAADVTLTLNASSGAVSGTIQRNDFITCGSSTDTNYWQMVVVRNGVKGPACNVRITASSFDATAPSCLNQVPSINVPDSIFTTTNTFSGPNTFTSILEINNVCYASAQAGSDAGAKINACIATLPTNGGVIHAEGLEDAQTITTSITVDRPVLLYIGASPIFTVSGSGEFAVTSSLRILCAHQSTNTVTRGALFRLSKAGALFRFPTGASSRVEHFEIGNCQFQGGGGSFDNYVVDVPSNSGGAFDGNQARWYFHDNWIAGFGSSASTKAALNFGDSIYWISINRNVFNNNFGGAINAGYADDMDVRNNNFWNLSLYQPHIRMVGGTLSHIAENEFETGPSSTMPDIQFYTESNNQRGDIVVANNKFGSENEDGSRSYKIRAYSSSYTSALISKIFFIGNEFTGPVGSSMSYVFQTDNPTSAWKIIGNTFSNVGTLLNDAQTTVTTGAGQGVLKNNTIIPPITGTKCFANGGRGFWDVDQPDCSDSPRRSPNEQPELRNRLLYSEDLSNAAWTKLSGITVTTGQTDPFGTTRAVQLANAGSVTSANTNAVVSNSSLGNRIWVKFWAKAGTLDRLDVLYQDTTSAVPNDGTFKLKLDSTWREYKVSFTTLTPAHAHALYLYVGDSSQTNTGNLYVFGVQVSDYDSDYVATAGAAYSDTTIGTAFQRGVIFGNGGKAVKAIYEGSASLDFDLSGAGITCQDLTITVTGAASGDEVSIGIPDALASTAGVLFDAWVSATDTVKVRACDVTSGNPNPAAATVKAKVTHF